MKPFAFFASLGGLVALAGCSVTASTDVRAPSGVAGPNVASIPILAPEMMGFTPEAVTSHASLVRMTDEATCFDLVIRRPALLPKDRVSPIYKFAVEVDGQQAAEVAASLPMCTPGGACLSEDSAIHRLALNDDTRIVVEAQRLCFSRIPRPHEEIVLSANPGMAAYRFRFHLVGAS